MLATAAASTAPRFVRKTTLADNEYRRNFRQIDNDVIDAITSPEADAITPLLGKIYLRLINAPHGYWAGPGVLRFEAEFRDEGRLTAWQVICKLLNVASSTANKALVWLHEQGIIGYNSKKNGVGITIFLNRASSSIGKRADVPTKKILPFKPASSEAGAASRFEAPINEFHDREDLELDINSRAPDGGADNLTPLRDLATDELPRTITPGTRYSGGSSPTTQPGITMTADVMTLAGALLPLLANQLSARIHGAAREAAADEMRRTREWLLNDALPKVARVAQCETYKTFRQLGGANGTAGAARSQIRVGAGPQEPFKPRLLSTQEIQDLADYCVSRLRTGGQSIEVTLSQLSASAGGCLLDQDAPKVRELAYQRAQPNQIPVVT